MAADAVIPNTYRGVTMHHDGSAFSMIGSTDALQALLDDQDFAPNGTRVYAPIADARYLLKGGLGFRPTRKQSGVWVPDGSAPRRTGLTLSESLTAGATLLLDGGQADPTRVHVIQGCTLTSGSKRIACAAGSVDQSNLGDFAIGLDVSKDRLFSSYVIRVAGDGSWFEVSAPKTHTRPRPHGDWSAAVQYDATTPGDRVEYGGAAYQTKGAVDPPIGTVPTNATYWQPALLLPAADYLPNDAAGVRIHLHKNAGNFADAMNTATLFATDCDDTTFEGIIRRGYMPPTENGNNPCGQYDGAIFEHAPGFHVTRSNGTVIRNVNIDGITGDFIEVDGVSQDTYLHDINVGGYNGLPAPLRAGIGTQARARSGRSWYSPLFVSGFVADDCSGMWTPRSGCDLEPGPGNTGPCDKVQLFRQDFLYHGLNLLAEGGKTYSSDIWLKDIVDRSNNVFNCGIEVGTLSGSGTWAELRTNGQPQRARWRIEGVRSLGGTPRRGTLIGIDGLYWHDNDVDATLECCRNWDFGPAPLKANVPPKVGGLGVASADNVGPRITLDAPNAEMKQGRYVRIAGTTATDPAAGQTRQLFTSGPLTFETRSGVPGVPHAWSPLPSASSKVDVYRCIPHPYGGAPYGNVITPFTIIDPIRRDVTTPPPTKPTPPAGLIAVETTPGTVLVDWNSPLEADVHEWWFYAWSAGQAKPTVPTAVRNVSNYTDAGVGPSVHRFYEVVAVNDTNVPSDPSATSFITASQNTPPSAPVLDDPPIVGSDYLVIDWAPPPVVDDVDHVDIERSLNGITAFVLVHTALPGEASWMDRPLTAGIPQYYRARVFDSLGLASAYSNVVTETPEVPIVLQRMPPLFVNGRSRVGGPDRVGGGFFDTPGVTEGITIGISDVSGPIAAQLARNDALALAIADARTVLGILARTDALAAALGEGSSVQAQHSVTDVLTVVIAEAIAPLGLADRADVIAVAIADAVSAMSGTANLADTLTIVLAEASQVVAEITEFVGSDDLTIALADAPAIVATAIAGDDLTTVSIEEVVERGFGVADDETVVIVETSAALGGPNVVDSEAVTIVDQTAPLGGPNVVDDAAIAIADASTSDLATTTGDDLYVIAGDERSAEDGQPIDVVDDLATPVDDGSELAQGPTLNDSLAVDLDDEILDRGVDSGDELDIDIDDEGEKFDTLSRYPRSPAPASLHDQRAPTSR